MASSAVPDVGFIVGDSVGGGDIVSCDGPIATRCGTVQQSTTRDPDITPGEELTGYS